MTRAMAVASKGHSTGSSDGGDFREALLAVHSVRGWLTDDQARVLHTRAREVSADRQIVEIGSYQGRSTIILARAAPERATLVAIDSYDGDNRGPRQVQGKTEEGNADHEAFVQNLQRTGVEHRVRQVRAHSQDALGLVSGTIGLLYIDGAHQYRAARDDIKRWGARVGDGGTMLIHDGFSSVGVTLSLLRVLAASRSWRYVGRTGSLVEYRRESARPLANLRGHIAAIPWFTRNLAIKLALVTRQRWICRSLGHDGEQWPY
jgi:hypothetical protein